MGIAWTIVVALWLLLAVANKVGEKYLVVVSVYVYLMGPSAKHPIPTGGDTAVDWTRN